MSAFADIGRMVLAAQIVDTLGGYEDHFELEKLVNAFVEKWGFVDIDEVPTDDYWKLVTSYDKGPVV